MTMWHYALLTVLVFATSAAFARSDDLVEIVQQLQKEVAELKAMETRQDEILTENKKEGAELKANEIRQDKILTENKKEIAELKADARELRQDKKDLMQEIQKIQDEKQMDADSMFFATISEYSISVVDGEPIIWDSAPINPGGHFNTLFGFYEAPVNGYYQFSVTKRGNNYYGTFYFLVDEVHYARKYLYTYGSNSTPASSATINIELTAGQVIRVENAGSNTIYGTESSGVMHSWFTGGLLYAL